MLETSNMKLLLLMCTALMAGGAKLNAGDAFYNSVVLSLKGQNIPSNGTGVVIFDDIGGYLGPEDGLLCTANFSDFAAQYWSYPNGTHITQLPSVNVFGIDTCHIEQCVSLYYSGRPKERGLFQCNLNNISSSLSVHTTFVYIVDINTTGPTLDWPGEIAVAGEYVELSINVTTSPQNVPVPYQWSRNGMDLQLNHTKYQGIQNNTLTIFNVQDKDQGNYTCSVAHSASGTRVNSTRLIVVTVGVKVSGSTNNQEIGKNYVLSCILSGVDALKDTQPEYQYIWFKDGRLLFDSGSTPSYTFDSLKITDAGNYKCRSNVTFNRQLSLGTAYGISAQFPLLFASVMYRIYLFIGTDCHQWTSANAENSDINIHIIRGINDECKIQAKSDVIPNNDGAFGCPKHYPKDTVVYSAQLLGNEETNTSILVSCLDKWIKTLKRITNKDVRILINHDCTGVTNDPNSDLDCEAPTTNHSTALAKGFIAALVFVFLLLICAVIEAAFIIYAIRNRYCRHRHGYNNLGAGGEGGGHQDNQNMNNQHV